jgi:hypothetical protein
VDNLSTSLKEGVNWMARNEKGSLDSVFEIVTLAPGIGGTILAAGVLLSQCWKWWETGVWHNEPLAGFVPSVLVEWTVMKEGGLLGLRKLVLTLLSIHASVWFFMVGWACTFLLYQLAKPWLKE